MKAIKMKQTIFHVGNVSVWFGKIPIQKSRMLPRASFLNGGCYWKLGFVWLKTLLEFSGPKKDKKSKYSLNYDENGIIMKDQYDG